MKNTLFGCWGHAFNRTIFHTTEDGAFNEFTLPAGAALIQRLLNREGLAKYEPLDDTLRCEYAELQRFDNKLTKEKYYAISRHLGFRPGNVCLTPGDAPYAIVFDRGLGEIHPPGGNGPVIWASDAVLPEKKVFGEIAQRCFLLLDANVLRSSGAMISAKVSWERTATELIRQLKHNPALSYLCRAPHILITFAEDGAVYLRRDQSRTSISLSLAHGGGENFLRDSAEGLVPDSFALMTTALALQLPGITEGKKPLRILPVLKAAEHLLTQGYPPDTLRKGMLSLMPADPGGMEIPFEIPAAAGQSITAPDTWCVTDNMQDRRIFDMACDYVLKGARIIGGLPQLSFGALTTIDRWEIESYQNICNLIDNYVSSDSVRPLSIAVFGAPGSGKSFGVTQIAENILPGKVKKLEFNVSQFTDTSNLGVAFQKVRDVMLEGKLPLVFFDEFDSDRNGLPLGWIKNFLMPMQDGKFQDESGEHPLGKCILVFAGGTKATFDDFSRPGLLGNSGEQKKFKDQKGPDFVSRLRGTVNVLGPNPAGKDDKNYLLRRALLLRSLCERKLKVKKGDTIPISRNILWAMLLVPEYRHGARSMEAILDMSRIEGQVWEPASLPFYSQLSLHVDADAFIRLVLREVILNSYIEQLAVAIHENYRVEMIARGEASHPNVVYWDELAEEFKESNRNQARDMAAKLKSVGYEYDSGDTPFPSAEQLDEETVLSLAQREHLRWCDEKLANGWLHAPLPSETDKETAIQDMRRKKLSHLLVPWEQLAREEQDKDIRAVENIIPLLKSIGLRVYKVE